MPTSNPSTLAGTLGRGMLSGLAGTAVMTAFQRYVEMPLTGRGESYAPAKLAEKILPIGVDPVGVDSQAAWIDWTSGSFQVAATSSGVL